MLQGREAPDCHYKPSVSHIAPREEDWRPAKSNTQTPPLAGPVRALIYRLLHKNSCA